MPKVTLVVRETGRSSPDYALDFDLPSVPEIGSYISISRPDSRQWTEDLIVRYVWWQLHHPSTATVGTGKEIGKTREIIVECDVAEGPTSSDHWRQLAEGARTGRGVDVPVFDIGRFSISEKEFDAIGKGDGPPEQ